MTNTAFFETLVNNAQSAHCREVLVVAGQFDWAVAQLQTGFGSLSGALWVGDNAPAGVASCQLDAGRDYLGRDIGHVVVNTHSGLHPNSVAAISGALTAGSVFILLCPALDVWSQRADSDYRRLCSFGYQPPSQQLFIARIVRLIRRQPDIYLYQQGQPCPAISARPVRVPVSVEAPFRSADQALMYEQILQVSLGHRRRPLVITAKRGRGKSAALGLAASVLISRHQKRIIVTAPRRNAVDSLFERLAPEQHTQVQFLLPHELERLQPQADLVLVDEAAGIPVPLLSVWLKRYSRIVFSTTNYGYEGYGQGFSLRFQPELVAHAPQHKHYSPEQAVRWLCPDPLEQSCAQWFMLDQGLSPAPTVPVDSYYLLSRQQLFDDEALLQQVYGLLLGAHYQTTPDDLRMLLDAPQLRIAVATASDEVVGVVLIGLEGNLPPKLHDNICAAKRRVAGHLVPQLIATTTACRDWLTALNWRVIRIAVHPSLRRAGIGSGLLQFVKAQALAADVHWLTASFGLRADVLGFWQANGFAPVCISARADHASGAHSGVVSVGLNDSAIASVAKLQQQLQALLPLALRDYLQALDVDTVIGLINTHAVVDTEVAASLRWFAFGHSSLSANLLALNALAMSGGAINDKAYRALVRCVLMGLSVAETVALEGFTGKAQLLASLRELVAGRLRQT